jgi:FkbM family methyltransferase
MTFISYAQNGEDVILWRALKDVEDGFYIDVGACDPDDLSVTKAFSERGWRGLNIEPVRQYYELCVAKRPRDINLNVAVTAKSGIAHLNVVKDTGLSTTISAVAAEAAHKGWSVETEDVPALSLADICETLPPQEIHFLKIDVEGGEQAVLQGADFERFRPWVVVVEATVPLSMERNEHLWEDLLIGARYERVLFDGVNLYYVAEEHRALAERLAAPPNALDDFKPVRLANAEQQAASFAADAAARQHEAQQARAALEDLRQQHEALRAEAAERERAHAAHVADLAAEVAAREHALQQTQAALEALRQSHEALEARSAEQDRAQDALQREVSDLRSHVAHQATVSQQRVDFTTRKLAQSRRKIMDLEHHLHAREDVIAAAEGVLDLNEPEDGLGRQIGLAARVEALLERQAAAIGLLRSRCSMLDARYSVLASRLEDVQFDNDILRHHRDRLLSSTSWRVSAPLRKVKTALVVAHREPDQFMPLIVHNLYRRPIPALESLRVSAADCDPVVEGEPAAPALPAPAHLPLPMQVVAPGTPEYEALDQRGQLAALIRRDVAQRRLAG